MESEEDEESVLEMRFCDQLNELLHFCDLIQVTTDNMYSLMPILSQYREKVRDAIDTI